MKPYNNSLMLTQMAKKITRDEKIMYLRMALNLQHIGATDELSDRIIETYEGILNLGDKFSIKDIAKIEVYMSEKYSKNKVKDDE